MFANFIKKLFSGITSFLSGLIDIILIPFKLLYYLLDGIIYLLSRLFLVLVDLLTFVYRLMQFLFSMSKMLLSFVVDLITFRVDLLTYKIPYTSVNLGISAVTDIFAQVGIMTTLPIILTVIIWFVFAQSVMRLFRGEK